MPTDKNIKDPVRLERTGEVSLIRRKVVNMEVLKDKVVQKEIIGLRDFRKNVSDIYERVIGHFDNILAGNVKKNSKTISIIATDSLKNLLDCYEFKPKIDYCGETSQHSIVFEEIQAYGSGDTYQEAVEITLDNIKSLTEDYFEELDLYMRMAEYKEQYPYYLRIQLCTSAEELLKVLSLEH